MKHAASLVMIATVTLSLAAAPTAPARAAPAKIEKDEATKEPSVETLWPAISNGQFKAAIHVRYHNYFANYYGEVDRSARFVALLVGVFGYCGPFFIKRLPRNSRIKGFAFKPPKWANVGLFILGTAGIIFSLYGTVYPYNEWSSKHTVALQRWNALRIDWETLKDKYQDHRTTYDELAQQIAKLHREEAAIEDLEPPISDEAKMAQFIREEATFQGKPLPPIYNTKDFEKNWL